MKVTAKVPKRSTYINRYLIPRSQQHHFQDAENFFAARKNNQPLTLFDQCVLVKKLVFLI